jgi:hypothetical protein
VQNFFLYIHRDDPVISFMISFAPAWIRSTRVSIRMQAIGFFVLQSLPPRELFALINLLLAAGKPI